MFSNVNSKFWNSNKISLESDEMEIDKILGATIDRFFNWGTQCELHT